VTETDEALAARSRQGDREAFEELVRRTGRGLFARIYLETADAHKAEDLAQETYLCAWRSIRGLADPKVFRPWLNTIARSVMADAARRELRKKRKGRRSSEDSIDTLPDARPTPSQDADRRDQQEKVLAVLRSMPEEYRLPLMMRYLAGANYETIGRELAITNGSLRGLLSRGMAMLREELKDEIFDGNEK
jgi:RNA polymerase sigma-70 factor (ECF subfamily)